MGKSTLPRTLSEGRGVGNGLPNEAVLMSPRFTSSSRRFSEKRSVRDGSRVPQNFSSCGDDGESGGLGGSAGSVVGLRFAGIRLLVALSFLYNRSAKGELALTRW